MKKLLLSILFLSISLVTFSKTLEEGDRELSQAYSPKKNFVKINLTNLALKDYSLQYERALSKRISIAMTGQLMPERGIPSLLYNFFDKDEADDIRQELEGLRISSNSLTPEVRFYLGKRGYGRGFYIAPFGRVSKFVVDNFNFSVEFGDGEDKYEKSVLINGDANILSFGLLFGAQWSLSKNIALDWWILGPHLGPGKVNLNLYSGTELNTLEQNEIRDMLDSFEIPLAKSIEYSVNSRGAFFKSDGFLGGIRAGLCIGFKF